MSAKSHPYTNRLLSEPWQILQPDLLITSKARADSENMKASIEKVTALFEHFSISPTDPEAFQKLSIALAMEHVPGFQAKTGKGVGRPNKWMTGFGVQFFWDVYQKAKERDFNYSWACQQLAKLPAYCQYDWETLYARFKEILNNHPASSMMRHLVYGEKTDIKSE